MISRFHSVALQGIGGIVCEVEVNVTSRGFAGPVIVGLPDAAVKESVERVRSAIASSGYSFPKHKTVINLAPADVRKEGPAFDLPIALALIAANGDAEAPFAEKYLVCGELALDGRVRPVKGALCAAMLARELKYTGLLCPADNAAEAAVVTDVDVIPVTSLTEALGFMTGQLPLEPTVVDLMTVFNHAGRYDVDFADVRGQEGAKRALTIAAAGGHNILLIGPPGAGKTMLSKRLPTILPPLTLAESLETTRIYSVAGLLCPGQSLMATRPVRAPHHSASGAALVGGGSIPAPGEVSLAHHGVLFLDEFPEFPRANLEILRQPLEDGMVTIARAYASVEFPAKFMLVAAMNPCPCGYYTDPRKTCKCSVLQIDKYLSKISGPLVDRIDIHIEVPAVDYRQLRGEHDGESSAVVREQVAACRRRQQQRFGEGATTINATMSSSQTRKFCKLDSAGEAILRQSMTELGLSARAHDKILRVSRTIADLAEAEDIKAENVSEAIMYRRLDRQL